MKTTIGVWIDHRRAVLVEMAAKGEKTRKIESRVDRQPGRVAGVRSTGPYEAQLVPADDSRERKLTGHLHDYYDKVISAIRGADAILLFGPGEAKGELEKRLQAEALGHRIVVLQTADRMTDREFAARVRAHVREFSSAGAPRAPTS